MLLKPQKKRRADDALHSVFALLYTIIKILIKIKEMSADLVSFHGQLSSSLAREVHASSQKPVAKLPVKHPVFLFQVAPKLLLLFQVFLRFGADHQDGGNCGNDVQVTEHIAIKLFVA